MSKDRAGVLAVFGTVQVPRMFCQDCQQLAMVVSGYFQCCDNKCDEAPEMWKRESDLDGQRAQPSKRAMAAQLILQENRCLYCERTLGSHVKYRGKAVRLRMHFDHFFPLSYSRDNSNENFVIACHICNQIKSNKCFQTVEEVRLYVATKREQKEQTYRKSQMPAVWNYIRSS